MNMQVGQKFEKEVLNLLSLMGYQVKHDCLLAGKQADIIAEFMAPGGLNFRILVECKYKSTGTVGNKVVYELAALYKAIGDQQSLSSAMLISNVGFSRYAKEAAKNANIEVLQYDELFHNIADFRPYLSSIVDEYIDSPISKSYIKLRYCTSRQVKQLERIQDPRKRRQKSSGIREILDDYIYDWLDRKTKYQMLLLGDYGTGKTTVCMRFAYLFAKKYLQFGSRQRIPLLVSLRDYAHGPGARQLITDFLVNKCNVRINYDIFKKMNRLGKFILILDGFDEMAARVEPSVTIDLIQNLNELMVTGSKILLTGRPGYFPSQNELESSFRSGLPVDPYEKVYAERIEKEVPYFRHLYILPFKHEQVVQLLSKREDELWSAGRITCDQVIKTIETTYNLLDLAERPVLLDIIVKTIPKLSSRLKRVNAQRLYEIYTDFWIQREETKRRKLISKKDKLLFMEELAFQMFLKEKLVVNYIGLSPTIKEYFHIQESAKLDYFVHDIRTCSFLNRDSAGNYYFAHKSFMEFFVASKLANEIRNGTNWHFGRKRLTPEISNFIIQSSIFEKDQETIYKWLTSTKKSEGGLYTATNALALLLISGRDFSNVNFSNKNFEGLDLREKNFKKANLINCKLSRCNFSGANLEGALFEGADLSGALLNATNLSCANLRHSSLRGANLTNCNLENTDLQKSFLFGVEGWDKVKSFRQTQIADAEGLLFEQVDNAHLRGAVGTPKLSDIEIQRQDRDRIKKKLHKGGKRTKK